MIVNQLLALPDAGTLEYLTAIFSGCSFDVDFDAACVEINSSIHEIEPDPHRVYVARAGSLGIWYDSSTQDSSLILPLESAPLQARCMEVRSTAPTAFYEGFYIPFLVIKRHMPPKARSYRAFVNSVSDVLYANRQPLIFGSELVVQQDYEYVPDMDFYVSQLATRA